MPCYPQRYRVRVVDYRSVLRPPVWLFGLLMLAFQTLTAQQISLLDRDQGLPQLRLGMDLSELYYNGRMIMDGEHCLKRREPLRVREYMNCEVRGIRYCHEAFRLREIQIDLDRHYDLVLRRALYRAYGRPTRFENQFGIEYAYWRSEHVTLEVQFPVGPLQSLDQPLRIRIFTGPPSRHPTRGD